MEAMSLNVCSMVLRNFDASKIVENAVLIVSQCCIDSMRMNIDVRERGAVLDKNDAMFLFCAGGDDSMIVDDDDDDDNEAMTPPPPRNCPNARTNDSHECCAPNAVC